MRRTNRRLPACSTAPTSDVARDVELGDGLVGDLDAALRDEPPRLARRQAERVGEDGRQMNGVAGGQRVLRHVLGCAALAHDAREVLLGRTRGVRPRASA